METPIRVTLMIEGEINPLLAQYLQSETVELTVIEISHVSDIAAQHVAAVSHAQVVFALTSQHHALTVAEQAAPLLGTGCIYVDLNTATPASKKRLAGLFPTESFVDAALKNPGSESDQLTLSVAGNGAQRLSELLSSLDLQIDVVSDVPGDATARKLLHDLFTKNITSVLIDTLWAAESMGLQEWAYEDIKQEFDSFSSARAQELITDASVNFKRSQIEMADVVEMLTDSGYESTMLAPIQFNYGRIMHGKKIPYSKPAKK